MQLAHSHSQHVCHRCANGPIYAAKDKQRVNSQQLMALDEAIAVYLYVHPEAKASKCLHAAGCPELKMQFSRLVNNFHATGTWEAIVTAAKSRPAPPLAVHFIDELTEGCDARVSAPTARPHPRYLLR